MAEIKREVDKMPYCPKCQQDIPDKAWKIHQVICKSKTVVQPPPIPVVEPYTDAEVKRAAEVVSTEAQHEAEVETTEQTVIPPEPENGGQTEIVYPELDPNFMVNKLVMDALMEADKLSMSEPVNLLFTGHAGGGKTSLAFQFAAVTHRPLVVADFGVVQEPQQLFQTTHLVKGEGNFNVTETRESAFIRGIETERCVVVMDELTRVENERCLNPLMPLLDGRNKAWIDELRRWVKVAPGVVFIATINEGTLFCGVSSLDAALRDRFAEIFMPYLPADQEMEVVKRKTGIPDTIALTLAQFAAIVRQTDDIEKKVSTRQMLRAAKYYSVGAPLWHAVELSIGNFNDDTWRQRVMEVYSLNIKDPDEEIRWQNKRADEDTFVLFQ
jgi:nitric oxide reductase NorQ protein